MLVSCSKNWQADAVWLLALATAGHIETSKQRLRRVHDQLSRCRVDVAAFTRTLVRAKEAVKMAAQTQNMSWSQQKIWLILDNAFCSFSLFGSGWLQKWGDFKSATCFSPIFQERSGWLQGILAFFGRTRIFGSQLHVLTGCAGHVRWTNRRSASAGGVSPKDWGRTRRKIEMSWATA